MKGRKRSHAHVFGDAQRHPKLTPLRWNHRNRPPYCAMCIQQWSITMIDNEMSKPIGKRPTHRHNNQILNAATAKDDELDAQNAITKKKGGQKEQGERCKDRTQQFNVIFFGRWPRTRAPGWAANSSKREEDERVFPPHRSHEATMENNERCEGARDNQPSFWRLETRRSRRRRSR